MAELGDFLTFGSYDTGDSVGKPEGDLCVPEHDDLVEYMDFDYIEKCSDKAMLRGILKKLKSGKEAIILRWRNAVKKSYYHYCLPKW